MCVLDEWPRSLICNLTSDYMEIDKNECQALILVRVL